MRPAAPVETRALPEIRPPAGGRVVGTVTLPAEYAAARIYIGAFDTPIIQRRPVSCTVVEATGAFDIARRPRRKTDLPVLYAVPNLEPRSRTGNPRSRPARSKRRRADWSGRGSPSEPRRRAVNRRRSAISRCTAAHPRAYSQAVSTVTGGGNEGTA